VLYVAGEDRYTATQAAAPRPWPLRELLTQGQPTPLGFSFLGFCWLPALIPLSGALLSCA
jgi:hypothetical protein